MPTLVFGLKVAVLGISVVFVGLFILVLVIMLMAKGTKLFAPTRENKASGDMPSPEGVGKSGVEMLVCPEDDAVAAEIVAVITAAIRALKPGKRIKIGTIRRLETETVSLWSMLGRQEIMSGRAGR